MSRYRAAALTVATALSVATVGWPLFAVSAPALSWLTALVLPVAVVLLINDLVEGFAARQLAVSIGLVAVAVAVRALSPGVSGLEPIWLVVIVAGRALGASAGFVIGSGAVFASAIATGGVGPWLPHQMALAGLIGIGAGLLPRNQGAERWLLAGYGAVAGLLFGWGMNLWFWPTAHGLQPALALDLSAPLSERAAALVRFSLATSLGFDLPRAALTAALLLTLSPRLLASVRRIAQPAAA